MSHYKKRIALLKQRSFLAYALGLFFSALGNGLGYIALSWLVVSQHSSASAIAILMASFWAPNIVFGPLMGVLADRYSRKWIITLSNFARGAIFIGFSIYLIHYFSVTMIYSMMFFTGIAFSAFSATAFAFIRELVPEEDLVYANSTIDIAYEIGNVVGMSLAGLIIAVTSSEFAVFINGITFMIATVCLLFIPRKTPLPRARKSVPKMRIVQDFKDGINYIAAKRALMAIYILQLLIMVTFMTQPLLLVPFSKSVLHATVGQFGIIEMLFSSGIVVGGILIPWIADKCGFFRTILLLTIMLCLVYAVFGFNRSINLAEMMYFITGFAGSVWPLLISKSQNLTDLDFQGRVQSTFNSLSGLIMMIFYGSTGLIGKYFGVAHLYIIEVVITLIAILFLLKTRNVWSEQQKSQGALAIGAHDET